MKSSVGRFVVSYNVWIILVGLRDLSSMACGWIIYVCVRGYVCSAVRIIDLGNVLVNKHRSSVSNRRTRLVVSLYQAIVPSFFFA